MIQVQDVYVNRGARRVLRQLNCCIGPGKVTTVMGRNGAGKTTLLEAMTGRLPIVEGRIVWDDMLLQRISPVEMAGRRAVLSQQLQLNFPLRVEELVEMGTYSRHRDLSRYQRSVIIDEVMVRLDLEQFIGRYFHQLSGGERQRVLLAKCLAQLNCSRHLYSHQYLFLDEPTNSLDIEQQYYLLAQVRQLAREQQIGILAILHDINLAAQCSDEILLLKEGTIRYRGSPERVLTEKSLKDIFNINTTIGRHPVTDGPLITILPYEVCNRTETTIGGT
ncbi:MAG: ATP-binding cassette domain-containing protein [Saprospiraceae bacterium]|nr:ATP-binding cassette domain-containing protein [Lewinella sp.]